MFLTVPDKMIQMCVNQFYSRYLIEHLFVKVINYEAGLFHGRSFGVGTGGNSESILLLNLGLSL